MSRGTLHARLAIRDIPQETVTTSLPSATSSLSPIWIQQVWVRVFMRQTSPKFRHHFINRLAGGNTWVTHASSPSTCWLRRAFRVAAPHEMRAVLSDADANLKVVCAQQFHPDAKTLRAWWKEHVSVNRNTESADTYVDRGTKFKCLGTTVSNWPTSWSTDLSEKPVVAHLVNKSRLLYGSQNFVTVFWTAWWQIRIAFANKIKSVQTLRVSLSLIFSASLKKHQD